MNLPNKLTIFRIILVPVCIIFLVYGKYAFFLAALIIAFLTDGLDGFIARVRNERTEIGAFLDPLADKMLLNSIFIAFSITGKMPWWVTIVVLSRDVIIVLGWVLEHIIRQVSEIRPSIPGKITTFLEMLAILFAYLYHRHFPSLEIYLHWTIRVMVLFCIISGMHYIISGMKRLG